MTDSLVFSRALFLSCDYKFEVSPEDHYGYPSVMSYLQKCAKEKSEAGSVEQSKTLELLGRVASMMLDPSSLNEPFKAFFQDFQAGRRSALPEDFSVDELDFFEDILNDINEHWLKARLADLLWLLRKPKNAEHARIAIDLYISHVIDSETWHRGVKECLERAARLCIQIREFNKLKEIKNKLLAAFGSECPSSKFMSLWIADLLDKLKLDQDFQMDIAQSLQRKADELKANGDFYSARPYFELAAKKYLQCSNEQGWVESLCAKADCFELDADLRSNDSNIIANSFYDNAIQEYRRVPAKHRIAYSVEDKISFIRTKITQSGQASVDEMVLIKTPGVDISEIAKQSIDYVSGKNSPEEALGYFTRLYSGPKYKKLISNAKESMSQHFFTSMFGSSHISSDGRVVARTPPQNLNAGEDDPANKAVLQRQIQQAYSIEVQLAVQGQIMPSLRQMLREYRFTKELIIEACHHSPIVPQGREYLLGYGLWLGFEYEFGAAIHLLCPQLEHIVRVQLKEFGAHTSNIDRDGIENENGLSTLMELSESSQIFGEDLTFEIKSIFTESLGFNLRNQVAHGLLDDDSSLSISHIYAWWMILRLVILSIGHGNKIP